MKKIIKISFARFLSLSGIFRILQSTRHRRHVILAFHRIRESKTVHDSFDTCPSVSVDLFREILIYLKDHYKIVSLRTLYENSHLSNPLASITFDDGWKDNYDLAFPVLRKLSLPATIFVTTGKIGDSNPFWQQKLGQCFKFFAHKESITEQNKFKRSVDLDHSASLNDSTYIHTVQKFKSMSYSNIANRLASFNSFDNQSYDTRLFLSSEEIEEMSRFDIEFGSHTVNHLILTAEPENIVEFELRESKRMLHDITGKNIDMISYPNGSFSDKLIGTARSLGYKTGYTTKRGFVGRNNDAMKLPRIDFDWNQVCDERGKLSSYMLRWATR